MNLFYWKKPNSRNFGDDLNTFIWPKLLPDIFSESDDRFFLGSGSLLNHMIRFPENSTKYVFGSGVAYGLRPPQLDKSWRIYCLRGPLSSDALGLNRDTAVTASALLVRQLVETPNATETTHEFGFMPHHISADLGGPIWSKICEEVGIRYVDPRNTPEQVIEDILSVDCLITEAMHGAIVADALRVHWIPVIIGQEFSIFKWLSFHLSKSFTSKEKSS